MTNPTFPQLRQVFRVTAAALVLAALAASAQVTWPTLPKGFRATTNAVSVWAVDPMPDWATTAIQANDPAHLDNSLGSLVDQTKREDLKQRIFYESLSTPATKVAEWCLVNGASLGFHTVLTERRSLSLVPLDVAVSRTNVLMARLLMAAGADTMSRRGSSWPTAENFFFNTFRPYFGTWSAAAEKKTGIRSFWSAPKDPPSTSNLELSRLLIEAGFDPFATNGTRVLIDTAAENSLWYLVDILLTNQPLPVLRNERGSLSLNLALEHDLTNSVKFLRAVPAPMDIFAAAQLDDVPVIRSALASGASLDSKDRLGRTPLMLAIGKRASAAEEFLVGAGADLAVSDLSGRSVAHTAALMGNIRMLARLKSAGIPLDQPDHGSATPFQVAVEKRQTASANWLLAEGQLGTNGSSELIFKAAVSQGDDRLVLRLWYLFGQQGRLPKIGYASKPPEDKADRLLDRIRAKTPIFFPGLWSAKPELEKLWADAVLDDRPSLLETALKDVPVSKRRELFPDEALLTAVSCNLTNLAGWLIDQGFSVTGGPMPPPRWPTETGLLGGNPIGKTPLEVAVRERHAEMVSLLLSRQANPEASGNREHKPLSLLLLTIRSNESAVWRKAALDCAERLLAAGANPLSGASSFSRSPLDAFTPEGLWPINRAISDAPQLADSLLTNCVRTDITNRLGETLLHYAAKLDRVDALRTLARRGAKLDSRDRNGTTPLRAALAAGHERAAWTLRDRGATVDLLTLVESSDQPAAIKALKGARLDVTNAQGETVLHVAAKLGWTEFSKSLIAAGAALEASRHDGGTPLTAAVESRSAETVELLLSKGALPNGLKGGHTPLHAAVAVTNEPAVRRLAALGADPLALNRSGKSPLGLARERNLPALAALVGGGSPSANPASASPSSAQPPPGDLASTLFFAVTNGAIEVLEHAAKTTPLGSIRNARSESLMWAALGSKKTALFAFLATNGVSPDLRDTLGNTILHAAAAQLGRADALASLLSLGADPAATNLAGATPLHLVSGSQWSDPSQAMALLEAKAPLEALDLEGRTPLLALLERGSTNLPFVLLKAGASAKVRTRSGQTALHLLADAELESIHKGFPKESRRVFIRLENTGPVTALVKALVAAGAELNAQNADGDTALHLAARTANGLVEQALLKNEASVLIRNKAGESGLFLLCSGGEQSSPQWIVLPGVTGTVWSAVARRDTATLEEFLKADPAVLFAKNAGNFTLLRRIFIAPDPRPMLEIATRHLAEARKIMDAEPQLCAVLLDDAEKLKATLPPGTATDRNAAIWMNAAVLLERTNVIALLAKNGVPTVAATPGYASFPAIAERAGFDAYAKLAGGGSREDIWSAAADGDALKVAAIVRNNPALVTATNAAGLQAIHVAAAFGRTNVARALKEAGADVNALESGVDGGHPLQIAAYRKHAGMVRWLLDNGARINAVGTMGNTALHEAVAMASPEILALLIERGGDLSIRNQRRMKPADFAMQAMRDPKAFEEITRILVNNGESPGMRPPMSPFGIQPPTPRPPPLEPQSGKR